MGKRRSFILVMTLLIMAVCVCGCSKSKKSSAKAKTEGTFKICSDNSFIVTYSEDFKEEYYDKDELIEMVDKELTEFNNSDAVSKENGIVRESLEVKNKVAKLKLRFSNYNDYNTYARDYVNSERNAKLFLGTYEEAVTEGYGLNTTFMTVEDDTELSIDEIKEDDTLYVMYTNEGLQVSIDGTVVAIGSNVSEKDGLVKTSDKRENYIIYRLEK